MLALRVTCGSGSKGTNGGYETVKLYALFYESIYINKYKHELIIYDEGLLYYRSLDNKL